MQGGKLQLRGQFEGGGTEHYLFFRVKNEVYHGEKGTTSPLVWGMLGEREIINPVSGYFY